MHRTGRQRLEGGGIDIGQVGTVAQAVDGAAHLVRCARLLFIQCHPSVSGRQPLFLEFWSVMLRSFGTVVFSHGKESGPWGSKITAMAAAGRDMGGAVGSGGYCGLAGH